jgi:hypothetical protein
MWDNITLGGGTASNYIWRRSFSHFAKCCDVRFIVAIRDKADMTRTSSKRRV